MHSWACNIFQSEDLQVLWLSLRGGRVEEINKKAREKKATTGSHRERGAKDSTERVRGITDEDCEYENMAAITVVI